MTNRPAVLGLVCALQAPVYGWIGLLLTMSEWTGWTRVWLLRFDVLMLYATWLCAVGFSSVGIDRSFRRGKSLGGVAVAGFLVSVLPGTALALLVGGFFYSALVFPLTIY